MDVNRLNLLAKLSTELMTSLGDQAFLDDMLKRLMAALRAEQVALILRPYSAEDVHAQAVRTRLNEASLTIRQQIVEQTIQSNQPALGIEAPKTSLAGGRSVMCVPLCHVQQGVIGALYADHQDVKRPFTPDDLDFLTVCGNLFGLSLVPVNALPHPVGFVSQPLPAIRGLGDLIGDSRAMRKVYDAIRKAARAADGVLIQGETGTGKELAARAIHGLSPRKDGLFLGQNCAALPDPLLQSELFGHVQGAFTDANEDRVGLFEAAGEGTVFLDEIGDASLQMQASLLRVLAESEVVRVGDSNPRKVFARVIAATNRDLEAEVERGVFRRDLYYRLKVFSIVMPTLRERLEDIPMLAAYFLHRAQVRSGKAIPGWTAEAMLALLAHSWPGNVRELENEMVHAVAQCEAGKALEPACFSESLFAMGGSVPVGKGGLKDRLEVMERWMVLEALTQCKGNISQAADRLGLTRQGLQKKLRRYRL